MTTIFYKRPIKVSRVNFISEIFKDQKGHRKSRMVADEVSIRKNYFTFYLKCPSYKDLSVVSCSSLYCFVNLLLTF